MTKLMNERFMIQGANTDRSQFGVPECRHLEKDSMWIFFNFKELKMYA